MNPKVSEDLIFIFFLTDFVEYDVNCAIHLDTLPLEPLTPDSPIPVRAYDDQDEDKNYFFLLNPRFNTVDVTTRLTQKSMLIILL